VERFSDEAISGIKRALIGQCGRCAHARSTECPRTHSSRTSC
jgi:hypothetical protein